MAIVRVSGTVQTTNGSTNPTTISSPNTPVKITAPSLIVVNTNTNNTTASNYSPSPFSISISASASNVGNPNESPYDPTDVYDSAAHRQTGAVYISGGLGVEKDLNVGGHIYGRISEAVTSTELAVTATNIDSTFYPTFVSTLNPTSGTIIYGDNTGTFSGLTYNPAQGKLTVEQVNITSSTQSVSTTSGALHVHGGAGIEGNLTVDDIYTKVLRSLEGKIQIDPAGGLTEVVGDIRVLGQNPIGTAPVVTNVLYVTMDGDDTNDGRAQDPSRACRTITGAVNSPFYQPGTQIKVSPGHYLEDNPIRLKPYTSIMGSDIRTTGVEPINKTQDLFHLESGCYLAFMQFLNGRSGLLDGPYAAGFNRGAYCTAFPPLEGDERIDLFHSPYVQNCTNLSGPWLRDGTLFTPNQTVQIPASVGVGSWPANTTTIVVSVNTGTIELGMAINAGQQNPGFFNARTLMLANKPFLQEQVVAFVDQTFNSGTFTYDSAKCQRDLGLIVDSIATDVLYNSTSDSEFAGLQYWAQSSSAIAGEETTTTQAISYLQGLATAVAGSAGPTVSGLFDIVNDIITNGTANITDTIQPTELPSTDAGILAAYNALLDNKATFQNDVLVWIGTNHPGFVYDHDKCSRDVGFIIDSVAFDLLHNSNRQSVKSGVYYYTYSDVSSQVPTEVPQVTAAYNYLRSIIPNIVKGVPLSSTYQTGVTQNISGLPVSSDAIASQLQIRIDTIVDILLRGPSAVSAKTPISLTISSDPEAQDAFEILAANKDFIKAEVVAFIDTTVGIFQYSREKCYRDVGILVENIAYDAAFGGNQKAVESGLAYYNGVVSLIAGQEVQTAGAISYLNDLVQLVIVNETAPDLLSGTGLYSQVVNTALTGGDISGKAIRELFDIINSIITEGPTAAPAVYTSTGPDAAFVSAEILMQANRKFIQEDTISWINNRYKQFPYSKEKCKRDVGIIIDSIAGDMLYPSTNFSQSNFAGLQYWSQGAYTGLIASELTTTTSAVSYLRDLSAKVILGTTEADDAIVGVSRYQSTSSQYTGIQPGTAIEVATVNAGFATILSIISGNKAGWTDKIIPNGVPSELPSVVHSYELLQANKSYLQDEVIAYIEATKTPGFTYDDATCRRDIGYMIDSVGFDLLHGGNRQSIQAGLSYYSYSGSTSSIHLQETQTVDAFNYLGSILNNIVLNLEVSPLQTKVAQNTSLPEGDSTDATTMAQGITLINAIIGTGPSAANSQVPIGQDITTSTTGLASWKIIEANKDFIKEQVAAYIDIHYNPNSFQYDEALCYRDTGLLIDAVSQDILLGGNQRSIESGLAYWNKGYNYVSQQLTTTTSAIHYARDLALQVIANKEVVPQQGTVATQVVNTFFQYGGDYMPQEAVRRNFGIITDIINRGPQYAPPVYAGGGLFALTGINGLDVKIAPTVTSVESYNVYDETLCRRDSGYIIDGVYFDTALGTNYNAVTCGNAYRRGVSSVVLDYELSQTLGAIRYMKASSETLLSADSLAVARADAAYDEVMNIIEGGIPSNLIFTNPVGGNANNIAAKDQLIANKEFIKEEVVGWIQSQINSFVSPFVSFSYNSETCARDVGFIIDALCYDMLYGGNSATRNCARAYFSQSGVSQIPEENLQSVAAFNHMLTVAQDVIRGIAVSRSANVNIEQSQSGPFATNVEAGTLGILITIITDVIAAGNLLALPGVGNPSIGWVSSGIQTAVNALSTGKSDLIDNTIVYVNSEFSNTYIVGLSEPTVGFGNNATLYFGNTAVYPLLDNDVPDEWAQRRVDPIGAMGGSLVDGKVISTRSPIQSFVYDAFTQLTQGGRGIHITNDGYAQLVSVFTIFCSVGVQTDNGGIASIVNSNANFGDLCLVAKGYGARKFSGTVFNPSYKAYPVSPGPDGLDQYFPFGYWPNNARMEVFIPDADDRPHISLVMEVVPPETYFDVNGNITPFKNDQGLPGFLNASPTKATLTTGTIVINDINTDGIFVGNTVYIRDQNNNFTGPDGNLYADTGTTVVDIGYRSITLSKALTSGGVDPEFGEANTNWFNLYFCGNSYYSVLSSEVANNPTDVGSNILSVSTTTGITVDQVPAHVNALMHLNDVINLVINNQTVSGAPGTTEPQVIDNNIVGGANASTFINQRFTDIINIVSAVDATAAEAVIPKKLRDKTGTVSAGAGSAIALIKNNIAFITDELAQHVIDANIGGVVGNYNVEKCKRDTGLILQRLIYDLESGGRYNCVMTGLSYWSRNGTHHIVQLGENVRRNDLFPDGATVNFYQRSYISASGYVFEYVGAGTNYGSLPQVGRADPIQGKETVQLDSGKVFFTSTDQNGDFRIGPGLVISQATGVLSGRTFTKSLFANMTPFILAIEGGGI